MSQMPRVEANFAPLEGENCNTTLESPLFIAVRRFPSNTDLISALLQHGLVTQTKQKVPKTENKVKSNVVPPFSVRTQLSPADKKDVQLNFSCHL